MSRYNDLRVTWVQWFAWLRARREGNRHMRKVYEERRARQRTEQQPDEAPDERPGFRAAPALGVRRA
jgi:hypothetical protein